MNQEIIGVKDFIAILNETLVFAYPQVTVEGEVSGLKFYQGKWVFFDLKDDEAVLNCFMPLRSLKSELEDGMRVHVTGAPRVTLKGKLSFTARTVSLAGEGALKRAYELLKAKLEAEGLFETSRKRLLPRFPRVIGLVTSRDSAAYHDFIKILNERWRGVKVMLVNVAVQGLTASDQIEAALEYLNQLTPPPDVIVLIRGGGSLEDLQAFNSEQVARAVATSRTPTLVGVGHEVDISLADLVADQRAATPTDAARRVVPDMNQIEQTLNSQARRLQTDLSSLIEQVGQLVRRQLVAMENYLSQPRARLNHSETMLKRELRQFGLEVELRKQRLVQEGKRLVARQELVLTAHQNRLGGLTRLMGSFDPKFNLRRGYSIVRSGQRIVKSSQQVSIGDRLMIELGDGNLGSTVSDKK